MSAKKADNVRAANLPPREPIAVIGIGCRFPGGVHDPESFWKLMLDGKDAVADIPTDRWNHSIIYHPEPGKPGKTVARQAGTIGNIHDFDSSFFGISPREASQIDPQHRLALEVSWEALEDAGINLEKIAGSSTGVFVGVSTHEYAQLQTAETISTHTSTGQAACMAANRISYAFDLIGPSAAVDTACSSALVAVHLACSSIWSGESTMALAGGVNVFIDPMTFVGFSNLSMLSPDSRCMAFDARANGFCRGEGGGCVVLKPLSKALADHDRVYAVILGTGSNQDGHSQGLTFPSQASQEKLLRDVYTQAGVKPEQVRYIEAHGTGTQAGDPVETGAIGNILGKNRPADDKLIVGSVKTNIGHLESAAGMAGLIKACLVLKHRLIPRNLHFETPNPKIPFAEMNLRVPVATEPLTGKGPAVAGVNGFGFGGTNAHVIVSELPVDVAAQPAAKAQPPYLLPLSARSPEALKAIASAYDSLLTNPTETPALPDVCYTAAVRHTHHAYRLAVTGQSSNQLKERLQAYLAGKEQAGVATGRVASNQHQRLAFVFSGQGPQWWAMGRELIKREPVFRSAIERCDKVIQNLGNWSLLKELAADEKDSRMSVTAIAQPAIYAIQAALTELWKSWGIVPDAIVGHSVGEIAAGYAAGIMSLEEGARVAFHRGRLMDRATSQGRMLAVALSSSDVSRYLNGHKARVSVAAVNSPVSLTLSGESQALEEISKAIERDGVFCKFLRVNYAFHSPQMDPVEADILQSLHDLKPQPVTTPLVSTVSGGWSDGREWDASYWWKNLRQTVRFAEAIDVLVKEGYGIFLEVGPHPALAGSIKECLRQRNTTGSVLVSLRRDESETETILNSLAILHTLGAPVRWEGVYPAGRLVKLPSYPWQRERCWSEAEDRRRSRFLAPVHPILGTEKIASRPTWSNSLDTRLVPFLVHHQLQGAPILPATGYLEMALVAAQLVKENACQELEEVAIEAPCFLPENERISLEFRFGADLARFEIFSRSKRDSSWTRHASGKVIPLSGITPVVKETPDAIRHRLTEAVTSEKLYAAFAAVGLEYGPSFRGIRNAWRQDCEALAEIVLPAELEAEREKYQMHPALLDACVQMILAAVPKSLQSGNAYLPVLVDRLRFFNRPGTRVFSHVRLLEATEEAILADLQVLDEHGTLLVELKGLRCRGVESESAKSSPLDELLFVSEWQPQARPETTPAIASESWLILADHGPVGANLRQRLETRGQKVLTVRPGTGFAENPNHHYVVDPRQPEEMKKLMKSALASGLPTITKVVHLWSLDTVDAAHTTPKTLEQAEELGIGSLLHLVQALADWPNLTPPRLWVVTSHAQSPLRDERAQLAVAQVPLWGFRRVAGFEQPRLRPAIVDLGDPGSEEEIGSLFAEILADLPEDEIVLRQSDRFIHRYTRTSLEQCTPARIRPAVPSRQAFRVKTARQGVLDNLKLVAMPAPAPGRGDLAIEVKAAGLNFSDVLKALGLYPGVTPKTFSLGIECAGVISAMGEETEEMALSYGGPPMKVGDAVIAIAPHCFGSFVTTPLVYAYPKPDSLSFEQAAALPIVFMTAHYALNHVGRMCKGERMLVHAASGGVGLAAIQIARNVGAEIFATAGNPEKREFLKSLGVKHVMDSRSLSFADDVMDITNGEGVDLILNSLAGEAIPKGISILRPFGRFLEIGKRDIYGNSLLGMRPFRNNISFVAIDLDQTIRINPALASKLLGEVVHGFQTGAFSPLPVQSYPITEVVDAFRHMSKAQHIGKIILSNEVKQANVSFPHQKTEIRPDATYLITGGVSGFARTVAQWLADRGARQVVLISRSGPAAPQTREAIADLAQRGCQAHVWAADVTDPNQIKQVLDRIASELPPLRGIVHAAVVFDDGVMVRLDQKRLSAVTRPKIQGAWNLHSQTLGLPLDFFVMTSSIASIYGSPGQANYASANAFLDGLAHYRHGLGLPALTLNLGALESVGHVARHAEIGAYLANLGIPPIPPGDVLTTMEELLGGDSAQVGVAKLDFKRLSSGPMEMPPRFAALAVGGASASAGKNQDHQLLDALAKATPVQREKLLLTSLVHEMSRVLGVPADRFEVDRPLTELGLDSLMTVEIINWVEEALGLKLPTVELMRNPTTAELAKLLIKLLANKTSGETAAASTGAAFDLRADAQLDPTIIPQNNANYATQPLRPLLTGATGFLGAFLLKELLLKTPATVHCLVRAQDPKAGHERIREALQSYGIWDPALADRIVAVPGDLSQPLLGHSAEAFAVLAETVDTIYHSGAIVDFLKPYEVIKASNVLGTQEILRLACAGRSKMLHFVSSIAVFSPTKFAGQINEETVPSETDGLPDGYSQSKWVAEKLVTEAMRRGLPARIYRPGVLTGHSQTGSTNLNDATLQFFGASCKIGIVPDLGWHVDMTPIDYAVGALVHISTHPDQTANVFHLCSPEPPTITEVASWIREIGLSLEVVPYARWKKIMEERAAELKFEQILPLLPADEAGVVDRMGSKERRFSVVNTLHALQGSSVVPRSLARKQLLPLLRYLQQKNFVGLGGK